MLLQLEINLMQGVLKEYYGTKMEEGQMSVVSFLVND